MSVGLMIEQVDGQESDRYTPVSGEATFTTYWKPLIEQEGYAWLPMMQTGFPITEVDLPAVLSELRQLKRAVPRYYTPDSVAYQHMEENLTTLIGELEALDGKKVELFLG